MDGVKRISLIKPVADSLNVNVGDYVVFYDIDGTIILRKAPTFEYDTELKEKIKQLSDEELAERNKLLHEELGIDTLSFVKKSDNIYTMKWQEGMDEETANKIMDGALKTIITKHDLEEEKIVKRLERFQNMSLDSVEKIVEYGDLLDALDAYLDEKMDESEQEEFFKRVGSAMELDSEELLTVVKAVSNLPKQEIDRLKRISERRNTNEKNKKKY